MKYLRNVKPRTSKVKHDNSADNKTSPVKKKPRVHYPSIVPTAHAVPPVGEDKASHTRHVKILQLEERKMAPDKNVVADLMIKTFHFRRCEILEEPQPVQELLKMYPSMKRYNQVCNFYCVLTTM